MSFFDDASLAFLPSGAAGKDGKAYSIKPTDGTGDFTFSRGSNLSATRVGADGLIEKGRENLLLQSNQFDTIWTLNTTSVTSGQSGYDGSSDAWLLNSTGTGFPRIQQNVSTSGVFVFSVYAKAATDGFMLLRTSGANSQVWFDLSDGSISNSTGSEYISSTTEDVGNGWYRYSILANGSLTNVRIYPASAYGVYSTSGNGIYIQDSQVEVGTLATEVIESGATTGKAGLLEDEPRFDYSGDCPSLLLEPSRTNSVAQSEYLNGISWAGKIGVSFDTNTTTSPEGLGNSALLKEDSSNGSHFAYKDFALTNGSTYTISIFAKSNGTNRNLRFGDGGLGWSSGFNGYFDLTDGTATGGDIESMGNGWYRCSVTGTTNATTSRLIVYSTLGTASSYQGDGSSGVFLYGFQIEQGSYPTSYIPNHSGGTITRGADFPTTTISTDITDSTQGSVYFEFQSIADNNELALSYFTLNTSTTDNIRFGLTASGSEIYFRAKKDSVDLFSYTSNITNPTAVNKMAFRWGLNDWKLYLNGNPIYTNTSMATFESGDLTKLESDINGGAYKFLGNVKQLLVFSTKLTDNELQTLTT